MYWKVCAWRSVCWSMCFGIVELLFRVGFDSFHNSGKSIACFYCSWMKIHSSGRPRFTKKKGLSLFRTTSCYSDNTMTPTKFQRKSSGTPSFGPAFWLKCMRNASKPIGRISQHFGRINNPGATPRGTKQLPARSLFSIGGITKSRSRQDTKQASESITITSIINVERIASERQCRRRTIAK